MVLNSLFYARHESNDFYPDHNKLLYPSNFEIFHQEKFPMLPIHSVKHALLDQFLMQGKQHANHVRVPSLLLMVIVNLVLLDQFLMLAKHHAKHARIPKLSMLVVFRPALLEKFLMATKLPAKDVRTPKLQLLVIANLAHQQRV